MTPEDRERRWEKARHLIHENGVSYNVYGDPRGMERPWSLSPVPVLIAAEEWSALAAGVAQRARLLDLLLADLYGEQRALAEGWLPPELVFAHPSFLRAVYRARVPDGRWLPLYGVDVVRGPDGRFRALADRTQVPSGAGYALENRIVVARALPELFRACNVERLALFFRTLQETLAGTARHNRDKARVVVLTPGPYSATFFEQAYLAQYLGYTLASGGDLAVRDERVYLKTLSGLQLVDVILRRVNDDYCDPLELRPDSVLGVPGLVQAVRQGNVALANPLGTGVLHTTAILPYLPQIARHLLGEELALPSAETFWCGDPAAMAVVRDRFDRLVFKPTFPEGFTLPVFVAGLAQGERDRFRACVEAAPRHWVAQEQIAVSTTPSLDEDTLAPRALVLRAYAVAVAKDGYMVMPGALSRVARDRDNPDVSMQVGAGSKDTWVMGAGPVSAFSLLPPPSFPVAISRGGGDLPSRAADNLFWLGRYAERAESIARLARVVAARLHDGPAEQMLAVDSEAMILFRALAAQTEAPLPHPADLATAESQLLLAVLDVERNGSLAAVAQRTLRVARMVRDRLSADTWRVIATLDHVLGVRAIEETRSRLGAITGLLDRTVQTLAAFSGLAMESMTRGQAWRFLDIGRRLERLASMALLLRNTLARRTEREAPTLEAILAVADSGITYRRRYLASLQTAPVLDLLLMDESNPRSAVFQLRALVEHVHALPPQLDAGIRSPQVRFAMAALAEVQAADVELLAATDMDGVRGDLERFVARVEAQIPAISDSLSSTYLNHAPVSRRS